MPWYESKVDSQRRCRHCQTLEGEKHQGCGEEPDDGGYDYDQPDWNDT